MYIYMHKITAFTQILCQTGKSPHLYDIRNCDTLDASKILYLVIYDII